jgi:hypothetical protein
MKKGMFALIGCGGLVVIILILGLSCYSFLNGVRKETVTQETALSAQYQSNQNYLSAYISGFYEQLGVANLKSDKMDKILTDAVKGRYGEDGFKPGGAFVSAMKEAYPDLKGLDIYDRIITYVSGQREGYKAIQDKLLDMLRTYDTWRESDYFRKVVLGFIGAPTNNLEARIGTEVWKGEMAEEKMKQIVLTEQATTAYKTGKMEPLKVK